LGKEGENSGGEGENFISDGFFCVASVAQRWEGGESFDFKRSNRKIQSIKGGGGWFAFFEEAEKKRKMQNV